MMGCQHPATKAGALAGKARFEAQRRAEKAARGQAKTLAEYVARSGRVVGGNYGGLQQPPKSELQKRILWVRLVAQSNLEWQD